MAVLVRSHHQADMVKTALAEAGIPAHMSKTGSVYESVHARELCDILMAVQEPGHLGLIRGALCTSVFGFLPIDLARRDDGFDGMWQDRFYGWKEAWEKRGFVHMLQDLLYSPDALLRPACAVDDRGVTNFHHLMELISQAALEQRLSSYFLLKWYKQQLGEPGQGEKAEELRLESDGKAVSIVTIHKSKGLEYPIVYLPFLWNASSFRGNGQAVLFHDPALDHRSCMDFRIKSESAESRDIQMDEDLAEQRRLLYVALTRASALCRVFWGELKDVGKSALGQILMEDGRAKVSQEEVLQSLVQAHPDAIGVETLSLSDGETEYVSDGNDLPELVSPLPPPRVKRAFHISSFSALTRGAETLPPPGESGEGDSDSQGLSEELRETRVCLADFPKGAGAGDFFHGVLESIDFQGNETELSTCVDQKLTQFGIRGQGLKRSSVQAFKDILSTPMDDGHQQFSLNQIPAAHRFTELAFYFSAHAFNMDRLARCFEENHGTSAYGHYLRQAMASDTTAFTGFIKGFIDLVVRYQGKWYILDYKSNFLGSTHGDYIERAVGEAMVSHHYILQYHLYLVALHRYLSHRLPDYDYQRDFGGVFYLFIRGMGPDCGQNGIYFSRPAKELLFRLDEFL
ncbi:MAG: PD-(D/E)XK nuclease family protein, partial [Desulfobacterales bacterium]|nr:PD-(D/E)XK nuclease family protein [Desulfobacterales bacterium]